MNDLVPVRHLAAADVALMLEWAAVEGWNPGVHDAETFYAADPGGFLASLDQAGDPVAVISLVRFGAEFAFLGCYICRPDLRGQGFGWSVWQAAMEQAGSRTIGLDGVPDQQANYARSGFTLAWQNARFEGVGGGPTPEGLIGLDEVPVADLVAMDTSIGGADRSRFIQLWVTQPGAVRLGVRRENQLVGWGLMRPCVTGWKVGPLLADDIEAVTILLDGLLAAVPSEPVFLDIPLPNERAVALARSRGMQPGFSTARMYRGTPPAVDLERLWGVASFELG